MDTFICGNCQDAFNDINLFMQHKQTACNRSQPEIIQVHVDGSSGEVTEVTGGESILEDGGTASSATLAFLNEMGVEGHLSTTQDSNGATHTYIILNNASGINSDGLQLGHVVAASAATGEEGGTTVTLAEAAHSVMKSVQDGAEPRKTPGRRGRKPKKAGEVKVDQMEAVATTPAKRGIPEKDKDGKFRCPGCQRTFTKERHFKTHKCLASSLYIDISKREIKLDSGDEGEPDETEAGEVDDDLEEYRLQDDLQRPPRFATDSSNEAGAAGKDNVAGDGSKADNSFTSLEVHTDCEPVGRETSRTTQAIEDVPIFRTEEEKMEFEQTLNVDLSCVDHMFKVHVIDQDINENAGSFGRGMLSTLSLYSCTVCEKVFKTLSHMRLHCLVHTDLKPYRCSKCQYATNTKGNLYTHMRKHTGQYYQCKNCDFRSVNKSHLLEHEATHDKTRHLCAICQRDYATGKSLINHVRKYHSNTKKGQQYLQTFLQGRTASGSTVIHQCHVCNRKFKKKIDRDRHLFVHDIRDMSMGYQCELCDHQASRRVYLERHYLKHRVLYCCSLCPSKFPSTVKLLEHLSGAHSEQQAVAGFEDLFEQCINSSLYLPEPDEQLQAEDKQFVNLPPELSSTAVSLAESQVCAATAATAESATETQESSDGLAVKSINNCIISDGPKDGTSTLPHLMDVDAAGCQATAQLEKGNNVDLPFRANTAQLTGVSPDAPKGPMVKFESALLSTDSKMADAGDFSTVGHACGGEGLSRVEVPLVPNPGQASGDEEEMEHTASSPDGGDNQEDSAPPGAEGLSEDSEKREGKKSIVVQLGYRKMNMQIFQKMRETFGSEECEFCGRLFYNKQDYEPHFRTHTGERPFRCEECAFGAITKENLRRHMEREHENVAYPCKDCDFVGTSRTKLWNHQLSHLGISGLQCPHCPDKLETIKRLRVHMTQSHPELSKEELDRLTGYRHKVQGKMGRRSYKCPYCERVFIRANSELQKHIWVHEGVKPFKCSLCPYACRSKNNLQAHMLRHSSHKPFACQECGKAYKSKTALRWHVRSHKSGNLFKCDKCPYEAQQRSHLKRHMETHDVMKRFLCQHCDYSANTAGYMKIHYARAHKGLQYTPELQVGSLGSDGVISDQQVYKCISCDYLFGNLSDLKRHLKIRHHIQVQEIAGMDQMQISEVEVVQCTDETQVTETTEIMEPSTILTTGDTETVTTTSDMDEKTASAVSLLQQIISMQNQGAFGHQEIKVMSEDGRLVSVSPETIIVQDGQQVLVTNHCHQELQAGGQFVIQYVDPDPDPRGMSIADPSLEGISMEIQTVDATESVEFVAE